MDASNWHATLCDPHDNQLSAAAILSPHLLPAYRQMYLPNILCTYIWSLCPKVAGNVQLWRHTNRLTHCVELDPNMLSCLVFPLQSRGCSAMAATSSRVRGMWTWAAPTQRSSPAPTHTRASNTVSALRQRAVSKPYMNSKEWLINCKLSSSLLIWRIFMWVAA